MVYEQVIIEPSKVSISKDAVWYMIQIKMICSK